MLFRFGLSLSIMMVSYRATLPNLVTESFALTPPRC